MHQMIHFTERLDKGIRTSAYVHDRAGHYRKGSEIPYIIHPFGVMLIAATATDDEDTLIASLLHDVREDVPDDIYSEADMLADFGQGVLSIVKDVTKNADEPDWHARGQQYLHHIRHHASPKAVIVTTADKIHNVSSILTDYAVVGDELWQRFTTKSAADQLWWYRSVLEVVTERQAPPVLVGQLGTLVTSLQAIVQRP